MAGADAAGHGDSVHENENESESRLCLGEERTLASLAVCSAGSACVVAAVEVAGGRAGSSP
jgi:hypothetical protein